MSIWHAALMVGLSGGIIAVLLGISRRIDRLIQQIVALRAELRVANGQETTGEFVSKLSAMGLYDPKNR